LNDAGHIVVNAIKRVRNLPAMSTHACNVPV
jgi:hypothetical protein